MSGWFFREASCKGRPPSVGEKELDMYNLWLLGACLLLGMALRCSGRMPESAPAALNAYVINISLPALTLFYVHRIDLLPGLTYSIAAPWLMFAIGAVFFHCLGQRAGWSRETIGSIILVGSLANTSFVGLPMIESFYGPEQMGLGIVIDQLGTYLVLSTLGILVGAIYAAREFRLSSVVRRVTSFPPLIALVAAILLRSVEFPQMADVVLQRLGGTLAPVALVSVGFQLRFAEIAGRARPLAIGLAFQLVFGPLLVLSILSGGLGFGGLAAQITIFELAMAPQIGAAIVAMEHRLDSPLATLMVGIGIPLSFVTLPAWWLALGTL